MPAALAEAYKSKSQQARVVTEAWGREELYCAACDADSLKPAPNNNAVFDYECGNCGAPFQLKGQSKKLGRTIGDGAYGSMIEAIRKDRTPNLFVMHYELPEWRVQNLILIPRFAFPESSIVCRKPLAITARRAGWVGCNIDLSRIAADARIPIVSAGIAEELAEVRERYQKLAPIADIKANQRGWTLDVLNIVRRLGKVEFTNDDVYAYERELERLHPDNRHVRPKIRQQLQVLRDARLIRHNGVGSWRIAE
ncbi:MAG: hypothetical protein K1X53_04055 [Candidatus Sumerlaeaceae bacterium]|nr:hypothetical protein [Candidatus Sumerlaeaceae bacterium]